METLESSRVCRLCGNKSGISINIFDRNENHVKKINAILPIMVHEMDLLPKHMCHRCSYKLEEFHKFYVDCLKTDTDLKSQLSWMRKEEKTERIGVPMVYIENVKIKVEPPDYDGYNLEPIVENVNYIETINPVGYPVNPGSIPREMTYTTYTRCRYCCDKKEELQVCNSSLGNGRNMDNVRENLFRSETSTSKAKRYVKRLEINNPASTVDTNNVNTLMEPTSVQNVQKETTRKLRPRRKSLDYTERRKKSTVQYNLKNIKQEKPTEVMFPVDNIKLEKPDQFEGRILRPRKQVNYMEPIRSSKKQPRTNPKPSKKSIGQSSSDNLKLNIKQELLEDSFITNDQTTTKKSNKPTKSPGKQLADFYNPKRFRIQPAYLRNGKVRRCNTRRYLPRKQTQRITSKAKLSPINLWKMTGINARLVESIKHYCEQCNVSFANLELYRIHACPDLHLLTT